MLDLISCEDDLSASTAVLVSDTKRHGSELDANTSMALLLLSSGTSWLHHEKAHAKH